VGGWVAGTVPEVAAVDGALVRFEEFGALPAARFEVEPEPRQANDVDGEAAHGALHIDLDRGVRREFQLLQPEVGQFVRLRNENLGDVCQSIEMEGVAQNSSLSLMGFSFSSQQAVPKQKSEVFAKRFWFWVVGNI
jgi:hypothetical protein